MYIINVLKINKHADFIVIVNFTLTSLKRMDNLHQLECPVTPFITTHVHQMKFCIFSFWNVYQQ